MGHPRSRPRSPVTDSPKPGGRSDCSLATLTKYFLNFVNRSPDGFVDLNELAAHLNVQVQQGKAGIREVHKRRIYDITNVLEGVGLIDKISKCNIKWKGHQSEPLEAQRTSASSSPDQAAMQDLARQQSALDAMIEQMQGCIAALTSPDSGNEDKLYITETDICDLFKGQNILTVKAPKGSVLEVADPLESGKLNYRMILRSVGGPIDVWVFNGVLCSGSPVVQDTIMSEQPPAQPQGLKHSRSPLSEDNFIWDLPHELEPANKRPASSPQLIFPDLQQAVAPADRASLLTSQNPLLHSPLYTELMSPDYESTRCYRPPACRQPPPQQQRRASHSGLYPSLLEPSSDHAPTFRAAPPSRKAGQLQHRRASHGCVPQPGWRPTPQRFDSWAPSIYEAWQHPLEELSHGESGFEDTEAQLRELLNCSSKDHLLSNMLDTF